MHIFDKGTYFKITIINKSLVHLRLRITGISNRNISCKILIQKIIIINFNF